MSKKIAVVGAGIMGLLQAFFLRKTGWDVVIYTDQDPLKTATIAAGAIWMPYMALPEDKVPSWAYHSLNFYKEMAKERASGVRLANHTEFFNAHVERPWWMKLASEPIPTNCRLPIGAVSFHAAHIPIIDTTKFVLYLLDQLKSLDTSIISKKINHFSELLNFKMIVNATGAGAGKLAKDDKVYPIKGQTFTLTQPACRLTESVFFDNGIIFTLVVPHEDHVTIGVTKHDHDDSLCYDYNEEKTLLQSAYILFPDLKQSRILERRVGSRPGRVEGIRLTEECLADTGQWVFHDYGHAGGGITLAPGCADDLLKRIENVYSNLFLRSRL